MTRLRWLAWLLLLGLCCGSLLAIFLSLDITTWASRTWTWDGRNFQLREPKALLLVCLLPFLALSARSSLTGLPATQRVLSVLLRAALLTSLVLALARPIELSPTSRVCSVVLVDVSASIGDRALSEAADSIRELQAQVSSGEASSESNASLQVIAFAADAHLVRLPEVDQQAGERLSARTLRAAATPDDSDIEAAFRLARAVSPGDCVTRYLLMTDGIETRGNAAAGINDARSRGVRISVLPLSERPNADLAITGVDMDRQVKLGEPFNVRVKVRTTRDTRGTLELLQGGGPNALEGSQELTLQAGEHVLSFQSVVRVKGETVYQAKWNSSADDQFPANNQFSTAIDVPGPPRVLVVDPAPASVSQLARALVAQQFDVDVRPPAAFPANRRELSDFSFVILSDLPRRELSRSSENLLLDYIQRGGGLLFAGGESSYGPGGWDGAPLARALPVRMHAEKTREIPGVALSLVIDRSGSMTGLPLQMAKEACIATLSVLSPDDLIEVIAFDGEPTRFVALQKARYRSRIESSLVSLQAGGGTEIFQALDVGYQDLAAINARKKHIILLTDGNASSEGLHDLSVTAFSEGITITTVGLGSGANGQLLSMIADGGGGRFHAVDDPTKLPQIFTRETAMISKKAAVTDWIPVLAARNPAFLAGVPLGSAPYLRGFTHTEMQPAPAELVLATDTGEPILARRPYGLGWTLAWTSDLKAHWATDWLKWGPITRFLAQLVRAHQLSSDEKMIELEIERSGAEVRASFDAFDEQQRFDSGLLSELIVKPPAASGLPPLSVPFQRVAPGRYAADVTLPGFGSYALLGTHRKRSPSGELIQVGMSRDSVARPYPEEYRDLAPKLERMKTWARAGGGLFSPRPGLVLEAGDERIVTEKGRQAALIFLSLGLFLLDLLVRRVRLFDRNFQRETARALRH